MENTLWWKTTFGGRLPSMEDDLRWKTTFGGRQPSAEDFLQWKMPLYSPYMTFGVGGRRPKKEDDFLWKKTFVGRQSTEADDLRQKKTFGGPCMLPTPLCSIFITQVVLLISKIKEKVQYMFSFHIIYIPNYLVIAITIFISVYIFNALKDHNYLSIIFLT